VDVKEFRRQTNYTVVILTGQEVCKKQNRVNVFFFCCATLSFYMIDATLVPMDHQLLRPCSINEHQFLKTAFA
jgi:hypothetical protein